jgi:hypothetical protein
MGRNLRPPKAGGRPNGRRAMWRAAKRAEARAGDAGLEEGGGSNAGGAFDQSDEGEPAGAVDGDEEMEPALGGLHRGDGDVDVSDGLGLERLPGRLVALDLGQARDAVALQAAVQR